MNFEQFQEYDLYQNTLDYRIKHVLFSMAREHFLQTIIYAKMNSMSFVDGVELDSKAFGPSIMDILLYRFFIFMNCDLPLK